MKMKILFLMAVMATAAPRSAVCQHITYYHDENVMRGAILSEMGQGDVPEYYQWFPLNQTHYAKNIHSYPKMVERMAALLTLRREEAYADSIRSSYESRAKEETWNFADRSINIVDGMSFASKGEQAREMIRELENKVQFIIPYGGTADEYLLWKQKIQCLKQAVDILSSNFLSKGYAGYMPNSQRETQYNNILSDLDKYKRNLDICIIGWKAQKKITNYKVQRLNYKVYKKRVKTTARNSLAHWQQNIYKTINAKK